MRKDVLAVDRRRPSLRDSVSTPLGLRACRETISRNDPCLSYRGPSGASAFSSFVSRAARVHRFWLLIRRPRTLVWSLGKVRYSANPFPRELSTTSLASSLTAVCLSQSFGSPSEPTRTRPSFLSDHFSTQLEASWASQAFSTSRGRWERWMRWTYQGTVMRVGGHWRRSAWSTTSKVSVIQPSLAGMTIHTSLLPSLTSVLCSHLRRRLVHHRERLHSNSSRLQADGLSRFRSHSDAHRRPLSRRTSQHPSPNPAITSQHADHPRL